MKGLFKVWPFILKIKSFFSVLDLHISMPFQHIVRDCFNSTNFSSSQLTKQVKKLSDLAISRLLFLSLEASYYYKVCLHSG